jgi:hypothetical protein
LAKFYGPFYEGNDGIWHWHRECPEFPSIDNPKMMVSTSFPTKIQLCISCSKIDEAGSNKNAGMKKFEG